MLAGKPYVTHVLFVGPDISNLSAARKPEKVLHVYHHLTSTQIHPLPHPLTLDLPISTTSTVSRPGDFASTAAELVSMYHSV